MGGAEPEGLLHTLAEPVTVGFAGLLGHPHPPEGVHRPLQRLVRLQTNDELTLGVDVSGLEGGDSGHLIGGDIQHPSGRALPGKQLGNLCKQLFGAGRRPAQEALIALVGAVIELDEAGDVHRLLPFAGRETAPCLAVSQGQPPLRRCGGWKLASRSCLRAPGRAFRMVRGGPQPFCSRTAWENSPICVGVVPQQPPMNLAPASIRAGM